MSDQQQQSAGEGDRSECTVCRGSGKVLSNLGGTLSEQPCPWCDGGGVFLPGHDAQRAPTGADSDGLAG